MAQKYYAAQEILRRCFENKSGRLKSSNTAYTVQDYLNAIYDSENDALRIIVDGVINNGGGNSGYWQSPVTSPNELPEEAEFGSIAPVVDETGYISFYRKGDEGWSILSTTSSLYTDFIEWGIENKSDLSFLLDKKDEINSLLGDNFSIRENKITFDSNNVSKQEIINGDNSVEEVYDMQVDGYVISLETYADNEAPEAEKYIAKMIYNKDEGVFGTTHIYFAMDEFDYFASLNYPKNVAEIYTIENKNNNNLNSNVIKEDTVVLTNNNVSPVRITIQDNLQNIEDVTDADGDITTHYRIQVKGYILSLETYANNNAVIADKILAKTIYDNYNNITNIYLTKEEYEYFSSLTPPKNVIEIYYIENKVKNNNKSLNYKNLYGVDFTPKHEMVYYYDIVDNTQIYFDVDYLNENEQIEFELNLTQGDVAYDVEFPENFVWSSLSQKEVNKTNTTYSINIRYRNSKFYGKIIAIF